MLYTGCSVLDMKHGDLDYYKGCEFAYRGENLGHSVHIYDLKQN